MVPSDFHIAAHGRDYYVGGEMPRPCHDKCSYICLGREYTAKHWSDVDRWIDVVELVRFVGSSQLTFFNIGI